MFASTNPYYMKYVLVFVCLNRTEMVKTFTLEATSQKLTYSLYIWAATREFGTYRLCEQRRFRRACASMQSRQNLRCSLIQAVNQEEPSDRKPDPWPLWMAGHAQLKFVMTECSKTQIRLTGLICLWNIPAGSRNDYFLKSWHNRLK